MVLVTVPRDLEEGVTAGGTAPQPAALSGGAPARLIRVERPRIANPPEQVLIGLGERFAGAGQEGIDASRRQAGTEKLFAELDHVTTGDTVAHRERYERCLKAGTEELAVSSRGSCARDLRPQRGQQRRWARCSITLTVSSGSSSIW